METYAYILQLGWFMWTMLIEYNVWDRKGLGLNSVVLGVSSNHCIVAIDATLMYMNPILGT